MQRRKKRKKEEKGGKKRKNCWKLGINRFDVDMGVGVEEVGDNAYLFSFMSIDA